MIIYHFSIDVKVIFWTPVIKSNSIPFLLGKVIQEDYLKTF